MCGTYILVSTRYSMYHTGKRASLQELLSAVQAGRKQRAANAAKSDLEGNYEACPAPAAMQHLCLCSGSCPCVHYGAT